MSEKLSSSMQINSIESAGRTIVRMLLDMDKEQRLAFFREREERDPLIRPNALLNELSADRPNRSLQPLSAEDVDAQAREHAKIAIEISRQPGAEAAEYYLESSWGAQQCVRDRALELLPEVTSQWMQVSHIGNDQIN